MDFFNELERIILLKDADKKCTATHNLFNQFKVENITLDHQQKVISIPTPGLPDNLQLVAPRKLKRRGMNTQQGRNILMHAIAHIEFNAINLALDAAYRFRQQPLHFYQDWLGVASDEARHFNLVRDYLQTHDCDYGEYPVHNGLWDMAVRTSNDVVARMALVPRVLEARGLDVTPTMIEKLEQAKDQTAVDILNTIYQDEINHVKIGSDWFSYQCKLRNLAPKETFIKMIDTHLHGDLKGPFNVSARLLAGFDEDELNKMAEI